MPGWWGIVISRHKIERNTQSFTYQNSWPCDFSVLNSFIRGTKFFVLLSLYMRAWVTQWWEHSPPTNEAPWVQIPVSTPYVRRLSKRPLKFFPVWFFSLVGYSFVAAWPRWSSLLSQRTYKRSTCSKSNMWVEFVVGSLLSSERFFSRVLRFSPLLKNQYFQIPVRLRFNEFIKTLKCFVGKHITKKELIFSTI